MGLITDITELEGTADFEIVPRDREGKYRTEVWMKDSYALRADANDGRPEA